MHLKTTQAHDFFKKNNAKMNEKQKSSSLPSDPQIPNLSPKVATINTFLHMGPVGGGYMHITLKFLHK